MHGVLHAGELLRLGRLGGEQAGQLLLPGGQHVDPEAAVSRTTGSVRAALSKHTSSSSGSSESEQTALAVMPTGPSGPLAVTTVTPVAKWPMTARKWAGADLVHQRITSVPCMPSSSLLPIGSNIV